MPTVASNSNLFLNQLPYLDTSQVLASAFTSNHYSEITQHLPFYRDKISVYLTSHVASRVSHRAPVTQPQGLRYPF